MNQSIRRVGSLALCLAMILSMLAGCGTKVPAETTAPQAETTAPATEPATEPTTDPTVPPTTGPTEYIGLSVDVPFDTPIDTYAETVTLTGSGDPQAPVTVNGIQADRDETGSFSCTVPLDPGENTVTVTHKEECFTYTVNRRYCVQFFTPNKARSYGSNATVFLSIAVREGSQLKATFQGQEIPMKRTVDQLGSGVAEGFELYKGYYYMPAWLTEDRNMGSVEYTVTCDGITEVCSSGDLTCNAYVDTTWNDPEATPEGYRNVGSGYIVEITDQSVETFDGWSTDNKSNPTYNYLPAGTVDYGYETTLTNGDGTQFFKLLRCGVRVHQRIKNTPNTNLSSVVDCYTGTLPDYNEINVADLSVEGHHTYLTLDCLWKAPFFFDFEPQEYADIYTRDWRVERFDASYVDITFCYATQVSGDITIPEDNPLFSHAEWIGNTSDHTLRLYLKVEGGLYGWDAFYNENDQLVFQFLNPVTVTKADNAYGADLTGVKVMIDVGHGSGDTGAAGLVSSGKYFLESERNLNLALLLKEELEKTGATVLLNRDSQEELLTQRERILYLKEQAPDYCIAIHHNAADSKTRHGFETGFFTIYSQLATEHIHYATDAADIYRSSYVMWYFYYVCRQTICPIVLTECGFMTNPEDMEGIGDQETNREKAVAMAQGVVNYFLEITEMNQ